MKNKGIGKKMVESPPLMKMNASVNRLEKTVTTKKQKRVNDKLSTPSSSNKKLKSAISSPTVRSPLTPTITKRLVLLRPISANSTPSMSKPAELPTIKVQTPPAADKSDMTSLFELIRNQSTPSNITNTVKQSADPPHTTSEQMKKTEISTVKHNSSLEDSDDDLPSFTEILSQEAKDISCGDLIWLRYRYYPWWPALIIKKSKTGKFYIKYLNSDNLKSGLRLKLTSTNHKPYPSDSYHTILNEVLNSDNIYRHAVKVATEQANHFISLKLERDDIDPVKTLFPNDDEDILHEDSWSESHRSDQLTAEGSSIGESGCSDQLTVGGPGSNEETPDESLEDEAEKPSKRVYSDHTNKIRSERDEWLRKIIQELQTKTAQDLISKMNRKKTYRRCSFISVKEESLGPFNYTSNDSLVGLLLDTVKKSASIEEELKFFIHILPEAILYGIRCVDSVSRATAVKTFKKNPSTREEMGLPELS